MIKISGKSVDSFQKAVLNKESENKNDGRNGNNSHLEMEENLVFLTFFEILCSRLGHIVAEYADESSFVKSCLGIENYPRQDLSEFCSQNESFHGTKRKSDEETS